MGTYNIPRNTKGESKILIIFSIKAFIFAIVGAAIGLPIHFIIKDATGGGYMGLIVSGVLAFIGFAIATFKIPEIGPLKFTKYTAGENIDDIIVRAVKFKGKGQRIYFYTKEDERDG